MNLFLRLLRLRLTVARRSRLDFLDVGRMPMRVALTDLDPLRHVNNGVYLSMMDLGRIDLMMRSGVWKRLTTAGYYPVVAAQTITYRKSLELGQRFMLETALRGFDEKAAYIEQRFVVDGEIYASAIVKARFLKRSGGTVSLDELGALVDQDLRVHAIDSKTARWSQDVALPTTREPAPSLWPGA
ncbi:acyl-CoA thioesterase [Lysinimonas soli]|uniref:Acyl-CoA thioesterase n=1 Tax=Lysinimonas soli TaxID=1074233 RepID=A0ABW0NQW3_9MICO